MGGRCWKKAGTAACSCNGPNGQVVCRFPPNVHRAFSTVASNVAGRTGGGPLQGIGLVRRERLHEAIDHAQPRSRAPSILSGRMKQTCRSGQR